MNNYSIGSGVNKIIFSYELLFMIGFFYEYDFFGGVTWGESQKKLAQKDYDFHAAKIL